jgi:hypothetical protein
LWATWGGLAPPERPAWLRVRAAADGAPWLRPAALEQLAALVAAADSEHTIAEHHQSMLAADFALSAATVGRMLLRLCAKRAKKDPQRRRGQQ